MATSPSQSTALFIFRRDLRASDNTALRAAVQAGHRVLPCFILDPRQLTPHSYLSIPARQFLFHSLKDLDTQLCDMGSKLFLFEGKADEVVHGLLSDTKNQVKALYVNRDYTPFSRNRDRALKLVCEKAGVQFHSHADALLHEPEDLHKDDGTPYTVFTPFYKKSQKLSVRPVEAAALPGNFLTQPVKSEVSWTLLSSLHPHPLPSLALSGGRAEAVSILKGISSFGDYKEQRDFPFLQGTTGLSPHLKFGTVSVREVYHAVAEHFGAAHTLIQELTWRDFFHHIAFHFPHVFSGAFHRVFDQVQWDTPGQKFEAWCNGLTGFPIVDAGMRQLNATGIMHNRVRMIVASFLVKDLHISWREGEKYFAQKLLDYDPCVNNGNWQWAASTGCDAQPYFRIFNPWLQGERFDPDALYIKKWIPELAALTPKQIHALGEEGATRPAGYPPPCVEHAVEKDIAIDLFDAVKKLAKA